MKKQTFITKLRSLDGTDLVDFIKQFGKDESLIKKWLSQYDPEKHDVMNNTKRRDKWVMKPDGSTNADGTPKLTLQLQPVSRIAVDAQQDIAKSAAGILCANKIELEGNADAVQEIWNNNKLDLKTIRTCLYWLAETEVAELWYKLENEWKVLIMAPSLGDRFYPVFDDLGKMICFARSYKAQEIIEGDTELKENTYYEIYLDTEVRRGNDNGDGLFIFTEWTKHGAPKIPVSYCTREKPVWNNAQGSIERFETSISGLCDTNDYFGSPTAVVKGTIKSYASKGDAGKILEIEGANGQDGDIKYLTWDQAPESIKLEWEKLNENIYERTRTVNLSITNMKGLFGSAPSAYAIKLLFTPAHMQAAEHEEVFGEYIQRRINIISSLVGGGDVTPKFTYYLPKNEKEQQDMIVQAVGAGIMSEESGIEQSVLTIDAEEEKARVKADDKKKLDAAKATVLKPINGSVPVN